MTDKELFQQAEKLGAIYDALSLANNFLENIHASYIRGDKFSAEWFFASNQADDVTSNLKNICSSILAVSNAICPDEFGSSEAE